MPYTTLTDLILPESMSADVLNGAVELSNFFQSGIVQDVSDSIDVMPSKGTVLMPFWNDLAGNSQLAHNGVDLTVNAVTQGQDVAAVLSRAQTYGSEDLAGAMKASDPITFIQERFSAYWAREFDRIALQNVIAAVSTTASGASMAANTLDISGLSGNAAIVSSEPMIDAQGVLGDHAEDLRIVVMHSAFERKLQKLDLIDDTPDSEGLPIKTYRGRQVIVTDRLAPTAGVYTVIFAAAGAVAYAKGTPKVAEEIYRLPLTNGGQEVAITRQIFAMHPRGIGFTGSIAGQTATDAELATAAKWARKWTAKNIKLALFKAKIA